MSIVVMKSQYNKQAKRVFWCLYIQHASGRFKNAQGILIKFGLVLIVNSFASVSFLRVYVIHLDRISV